MGFVWTDDPLVVQVTDVKALHWNEIQDGLDVVYAFLGINYNPACGPDWSADPITVAATTITPPPTIELRERADFAEDNCCPANNAVNNVDEKAVEDSSYDFGHNVTARASIELIYNAADNDSDHDADKHTEDNDDKGIYNANDDGTDNGTYDSWDRSVHYSNDKRSYNNNYEAGDETGYDSTDFGTYYSTNNDIVG